MSLSWPHKEESVPDGYSPIECFVYKDTCGKELPCNDIKELRLIQHGKEMVNLQIKMWVDSLLETPVVFGIWEIEEYCKDYPPWVFKSVLQQLKKHILERDDFIPKYLENYHPYA